MSRRKPSMREIFFSTVFSSSIAFFYIVRLPELIAMICTNPLIPLMIVVSIISLASLFLFPPRTLGILVRRIGLIFMVVIQIKQDMDKGMLYIKTYNASDLSDTLTIVTGANSGTGYAVTEQIYRLGGTVVMACRSTTKCTQALNDIKSSSKDSTTTLGDLHTMTLDLADLTSVKKFVQDFKKQHNRLDYLINNAGGIAEPGDRTAQGLELSFGAMHVGHFALTKWLLDLLTKPLPATTKHLNLNLSSRVIYVGSFAYIAGNFHPSLLTNSSGGGDFNGEITDNCAYYGPGNIFPCCPMASCINTNGYARAKLANQLHVHELQKRTDLYASQHGGSKYNRRLVTAVLHPGSVATNIHPFLSSKLLKYYFRTREEASEVILHAILSDDFVPSSYIDSMKFSHDLLNYRSNHLDASHLTAFPHARTLPFAKPSAIERWSFDIYWNRNAVLVKPRNAYSGLGLGSGSDAVLVAGRLFDVTEQIIKDWENKKPIFTTSIV